MRKMWRAFFLFTAIGISLFPAQGYSESILSESHIRYPVLITLDNGITASGFYVNNDAGEAYFVTARHILFKKDKIKSNLKLQGAKALLLSYPQGKENPDPIFIELELRKLYREGHVRPHRTTDVVVVKIGEFETKAEGLQKSLRFSKGVVQKGAEGANTEGTILGANPTVIRPYKDVSIGNDVFIFGYPVSLGMKNYPQIDYARPLLRRGAIAGKNEAKKTIILDCPTVYGNSGGPVIEVEKISLTQTKFWVIGVVSEFIPFQDTWYNVQRQSGTRYIENSGYSVVIPMDRVMELVNA